MSGHSRICFPVCTERHVCQPHRSGLPQWPVRENEITEPCRCRLLDHLQDHTAAAVAQWFQTWRRPEFEPLSNCKTTARPPPRHHRLDLVLILDRSVPTHPALPGQWRCCSTSEHSA